MMKTGINEIIKELREERKYYQPGIINNGENKIKMNDGSMKDIKEIKVNDKLENNNKVLGKIINKDLVDIYKLNNKNHNINVKIFYYINIY